MIDIYEACACVDEFLEACTDEDKECDKAEKKDIPASVKARIEEAKTCVSDIHEKIKKKLSDDHDLKVYLKVTNDIIKSSKDAISYNNVTLKILDKVDAPEYEKDAYRKSVEFQNKIHETNIANLEKDIKRAKEKDAKEKKTEDKATTEAYVDTLIELWRD